MDWGALRVWNDDEIAPQTGFPPHPHADMEIITYVRQGAITHEEDRKSTRLNSSHMSISYAVFCLKKKKKKNKEKLPSPTTMHTRAAPSQRNHVLSAAQAAA